MIHLFVPYYGEWHSYFQECLDSQNVKFRLFKYDRKESGEGWTSACNMFHREVSRYRGIEEDVICIMNNDITFGNSFLSEGCRVEQGTILIPHGTGVHIDWKTKKCYPGSDTFPGRAFFMCANDFIKSGGFCKLLPHYLADYDYGFKVIRGGMKIKEMTQGIKHIDHLVNRNAWSGRSVNNPISWTVFLLRNGRNRYIFLNLLKSWYELIKII